MDFSTFKTNIFKKCIASLAVLYLFIPLSSTFSEISHQLSHAISQTTAHHEHSETTVEDHSHNSVSFFDALFSLDKEDNNASQQTVPFNFDKHFTNADYSIPQIIRTPVQDNFGWVSSFYSVSFKMIAPPPKFLFFIKQNTSLKF